MGQARSTQLVHRGARGQSAAYQVLLAALGVRIGRDHEADGFIEHVDLVRFQVLDGGRQLPQQLCYERLRLPNLQPYMPPAVVKAVLCSTLQTPCKKNLTILRDCIPS